MAARRYKDRLARARSLAALLFCMCDPRASRAKLCGSASVRYTYMPTRLYIYMYIHCTHSVQMVPTSAPLWRKSSVFQCGPACMCAHRRGGVPYREYRLADARGFSRFASVSAGFIRVFAAAICCFLFSKFGSANRWDFGWFLNAEVCFIVLIFGSMGIYDENETFPTLRLKMSSLFLRSYF